MLIVDFCFGVFLEGAAGSSAPVTVTAILLVSPDSKSLCAAGLCLIVSTAPVALSTIDIPILAAEQVTGIDSSEVGQIVGHQLPFVAIIVLFWIMAIMGDWCGIKKTWSVVMVAGGPFATTRYLSFSLIGPKLSDIIPSLISLLCLTLFLRRWQPARVLRLGDLGASQIDMTLAHTGYAASQMLHAWTPFLFLIATVTLWSIPLLKALFTSGGALYGRAINIPVSYLGKLVARMPPVISEATACATMFRPDWLSAIGIAILLATLLSIIWLKMKPSSAINTFGSVLEELALPTYSIGAVLVFAFILNYSGSSPILALALAHTDHTFTFFSSFLGQLRVFLTRSDTSSDVLFAAL